MPKEDGSLNLSEVNHAIRQLLLDGLDEETGEISPAVTDQIDQLEDTRKHKILFIAKLIEDDEAQMVALAGKIAQLQARKKSKARQVEFYRGWLALNGDAGEVVADEEISVQIKEGVRCTMSDLDLLRESAPHLINWGERPEPKLKMMEAKKEVKATGEIPLGMTWTDKYRTIKIK
jgi:hypothetical protein